MPRQNPLNGPSPTTLYHASEEGDIERFEPRIGRTGEALVWAVGEAHLHNYLLPRDCPRVCFWALPESDPDAIERFLGLTTSTYVLAVEKAWLNRIRQTQLYLYELPSTGFEQIQECIYYYTTRQAVTPIDVHRIDDLLDALAQRDVELRLVDSLWGLHHAIVESGLMFSGIRLRNARITPDEVDIASHYLAP